MIEFIYNRTKSFINYNLLLFCYFFVLFITVLSVKCDLTLFINFFRLIFVYIVIGIGGFICNDLFDEQSDKIAQKNNISSTLSRKKLMLLTILLWSIGLITAKYISTIIFAILFLQISLLVIYSAKPFRLKEKGIWAILIDGLYAHLLPGIVLLIFINHYSTQVFVPLSFLLFSFGIGLRDILSHQLYDYPNDVKSNTKTYAVSYLNHAQKLHDVFYQLIALFIPLLWIEISFKLNQYYFIWQLILYMIILSILYLKNKSILLNSRHDLYVRLFVIITGLSLIYINLINENYFVIILLAHPYLMGSIRTHAHWTFLKCMYMLRVIFGKIFITVIPIIINKLLYLIFKLFGRDLTKEPLYQSENEFECIKKFKQFWRN